MRLKKRKKMYGHVMRENIENTVFFFHYFQSPVSNTSFSSLTVINDSFVPALPTICVRTVESKSFRT